MSDTEMQDSEQPPREAVIDDEASSSEGNQSGKDNEADSCNLHLDDVEPQANTGKRKKSVDDKWKRGKRNSNGDVEEKSQSLPPKQTVIRFTCFVVAVYEFTTLAVVKNVTL